MKNKKEIIYDLFEGKILIVDGKLMVYKETADINYDTAELKTVYKDKNILIKGTKSAINFLNNYKEVSEVEVTLYE